MKRLLIIFILISIPAILSAHDSLDEVHDKYAGRKGYQSLVYGKKMISMMQENASPDVRRLLDKISMIRIISHSGPEDKLCKDAMEAVSEDYELISRIDEEDSSSLFYIDEDNDDEMSFVMIVSGTEKNCVVLEIKGEFDIKDISRLSEIGQGR